MKNAFAKMSSPSSIMLLVAAFTAAAACGGGVDTSPFANQPPPADGGSQNPPPGTDSGTPPNGNDSGSSADSATPPTPDAGGTGCGTTPARYVVLGHSVAACFQVGGPTSETCALKNVETYMATKFSGLKYENYAVNGALIADVLNSQLPKVPTGAGNVFVNLYIGGNDLAAHLYESDAQAQQSWNNLKPQATKDLNSILSFFEDTTKFPDKVTVMINSQYNPFDECVAGQYSFVTLVKQGIIKEFNTLLGTIAQGHARAVVADQYTNFLGHGHNYNMSQCPKYVAGDAYWMADMIHPNELGHASLSKQMIGVVDTIYTCK